MNCANCGNELKLVFDQPMRRSTDYTTQYDNALVITIDGGYGMFFDDILSSLMGSPNKELTAILCHDCAHAFVRANAWAMQLLKNSMGEISSDHTADEYGHMHEGNDFGRRGQWS